MNRDLRLILIISIAIYVQPQAQSVIVLEDCGIPFIDPQDQNSNSSGQDTLVYTTFFEPDQFQRSFFVDINAFGGQQIDRTKVLALMPDGSQKPLGTLAFGNCLTCTEGFALVYDDSLLVEDEKDRGTIDLWLQSLGQPEFALQGSLQTLTGAGRIGGRVPFCAEGLVVEFVVNSNPANATTEFSTHIICPEIIQDCTINTELLVDCPRDSFSLTAIIPSKCFSDQVEVFWEAPDGRQITSLSFASKLSGHEGTYYLFVQDECCLQVDSILIRNPSFADAGTDQNICRDTELSFFGQGGISHYWILPDGNRVEDSIVSFASADPLLHQGPYILHAFNEEGCEDTDTVVVSIQPPSIPQVEVSDGCLGEDVSFTILNDSLFTIRSWLSPNGVQLTRPAILNLQAADFGNYRVLTTDLLGCKADTPFFVEGSNPPQFELILEERCDSTRAILMPDTLAYTWGDGNTANSLVTAAGGTYEVTATDSRGCAGISSFVLPSPSGPRFELDLEQPKCPGDFGRIEIRPVDSARPTIFSIDGGANYTVNTVFDRLEPGQYEVVAQDELGCLSRTPLEIIRPDTMGVTLNQEYLEVRPNARINLQASTIGNITEFQWIPGEIDTQGPSTEFMARHNMDVRIIVKDQNGCHAVDGFQLTVILSPILAPNAFSPNNDGRNDRFTLYSDQLSGEIIEQLSIFDRYGTLIYQTSEIPLNDEAQGWDGTHLGQLLTSGVYTYYGVVRYGNGIRKLVEGDVALIR